MAIVGASGAVLAGSRGVGVGGVQNVFDSHCGFLSENLFVAHTRLNRLRRSNNTRSVEAKQLDDGIGDTLVAARATSGVYKRARLRCRNCIVSRWVLDSVVTGI